MSRRKIEEGEDEDVLDKLCQNRIRHAQSFLSILDKVNI